jgi:hypothetical protein
MKHETSNVDRSTCHSVQFKVYTAVDPADRIHRPMPEQHPTSFTEEDLRELLAGIEPETAATQWTCRNLPLPASAWSDLGCWAFFVEAAPGMWVMFDDLPKTLADALLDKNFYDLMMRPIQRPFNAEELAALVKEIKKLNSATAVCDWSYADFCDPYGFGGVPPLQIGREYFVQAPSGPWVWFGDLPAETASALREKHERKLAFPAGLESLWANGKLGTQNELDEDLPRS